MSMAKRQQDLKDPGVRKRIEEFLREGEVMAEELKVRADGEHIVITAEGEAGTCEVKLTFAETERFEEALSKARKRVGLRIEKRRSNEATKIGGVDDEDFEEAE
jgi:hypothetical protein